MKTQEKDGSIMNFMGLTEAFRFGGVLNPLLGAILVVSLFLPWIQESQQLWGFAPAVSGFEFNPTIAKVGFFGGALVIITSFVRERRIRGSVFLGVGALALLLLIVVCFLSPTLREQSFFDTIDYVLGLGALLYGLASMGLIACGVGEFQNN